MRLMSIKKKSCTPKCGLQLLLFYIETGRKGKACLGRHKRLLNWKTFLSLQPPPPFEKKGSERCTFTKIRGLAKQDKIEKTSSHQKVRSCSLALYWFARPATSCLLSPKSDKDKGKWHAARPCPCRFSLIHSGQQINKERTNERK